MSIITINVDVGSPQNVRDLVDLQTAFEMAVSRVCGIVLHPADREQPQAEHWQKRQFRADISEESRAGVLREFRQKVGSWLEAKIDADGTINYQPRQQQSVHATDLVA